jgi:hypothetical protein
MVVNQFLFKISGKKLAEHAAGSFMFTCIYIQNYIKI